MKCEKQKNKRKDLLSLSMSCVNVCASVGLEDIPLLLMTHKRNTSTYSGEKNVCGTKAWFLADSHGQENQTNDHWEEEA